MAHLRIFPAHADSVLPFSEHVSPVLGMHGGNFAEFEEVGGNGDVLRIKGKGLGRALIKRVCKSAGF